MADIPRLDRDTADRLLSGRLAPDDAPAGYAATARLVQAAARPARSTAPEPKVLAAMSAAISTAPLTTPRRKSMLSKFATTKVALGALGVVVLSATGAAATGNLPVAQDTVASIASHTGLDLPHSASSTAKAVHDAKIGTPPGPGRGKAVSDAAHRANEARKAAHDAAKDADTTHADENGSTNGDAGKAKAAAKKAAKPHTAEADDDATETSTETETDDDGSQDGASHADDHAADHPGN